MTNENFYRKLGNPFKTVFSSVFQYSGILTGVGAILGHTLKESPTNAGEVELLLMGTFGLGQYVFGKGLEYAHRSDALSASFTHLEETLREEMKRK